MSVRLLLLVVLLTLWPGMGYAQLVYPNPPTPTPEFMEAMVGCLTWRLGPSFAVTRLFDTWIEVNGEVTFTAHRESPYQPRGVADKKIGGSEVAYWFDDDPLDPPLVFKYSASPAASASRNISHDPLYAVGVACFDAVYPRVP